MIKSSCLLFIIYITSMIYNNYILSIILLYISTMFYNNIIISLIILVQIDNFMLFKDLNKIKLDLDNLIKENEKKRITNINYLKPPNRFIKQFNGY